MKVKDVIDRVSSTKLWSLWQFEEEFNDLECVASYLDVKQHRWYEIATNVYKCEDGYVGVNGVAELKSESMDWSDCYCECTAMEYEAIPSITYKPKTNNE